MSENYNASVALVKAKIEQNRREKEAAEQKRAAAKQAREQEYVEFWKPLLDELRGVAAAFPDQIEIIEADLDNHRPYKIRMKSTYYKLDRYTEGRVGMSASYGSYNDRAASKEELLPIILNLIARVLT